MNIRLSLPVLIRKTGIMSDVIGFNRIILYFRNKLP